MSAPHEAALHKRLHVTVRWRGCADVMSTAVFSPWPSFPSALSFLHIQALKLLKYAPYNTVMKTAQEMLAQKGQRPGPGQDPLANTMADTISAPQYMTMCSWQLQRNSAAGDRHLSQHTMMVANVQRGDSARLVCLSDFGMPTLLDSVGK